MPILRARVRVWLLTAAALVATIPSATGARAETPLSCAQGGSLRIGGAIHSTMGTGGIPGVFLRLTGPGSCESDATSGRRGRYAFIGLLPGTYTVTPFHAGCGFDPASATITLSTRSRLVGFQATCV